VILECRNILDLHNMKHALVRFGAGSDSDAMSRLRTCMMGNARDVVTDGGNVLDLNICVALAP
jgi:hypothetical protein